MNKIKFIIVAILFTNCVVNAQFKKMSEIKTPNVNSIERFGDIPVNLFTGTPNILIPLYTIQSGDVSLPLVLNYHPSSVKHNQSPGWVGLGWNLDCMGSISREQKDGIDEFYIPNSANSFLIKGFYPNPANGVSGSEVLKSDASWGTPQKLVNSYAILGNNNTYYDKSADKFSFNFFGHSGEFYYSADKQKWVVYSNEDIKIEVNGFIDNRAFSHSSYGVFYKYFPFNNPLNPISNSRYSVGNDVNPSPTQTRFFNEFSLTTADGVKYVFGGIEAMEFTSNYSNPFGDNVTLSSWLLKKIIDSKGKIITFNYKRDYMHCKFFFSSSSVNSSFQDLQWSNNGWFVDKYKKSGSSSNFESVNPNSLYGSFVYPMYLSSIETDEQVISFYSDIANTLNYDYKNISTKRESQYGANYGSGGYVTLGEADDFNKYFKFKKLTSLNVTSKINNKIIKNYTFEYTEGNNIRFSLKNLYDYGNQLPSNEIIPPKNYSFQYDDIISLKQYGGNYTDHWGFFNNKNVGSLYSTVFANKETDKNFANKGLITEIIYPTGGFTKFEWEAHDHSRVLEERKNQLIPYYGFAGGSRIKKISNYTKIGELANEKEYLYVIGFDSKKSLNTLTSSGVLNGKPRYDFSFSNYLGWYGKTTFGFSMSGVNSSVNYSSTGNGSHIGYDEVVEVNSDKSYSKHFFTNYGSDVNGISHFDQAPVASTGWKIGDQSVYMNFSSLESERGKNIAVYDFNNNDILVRKINYTFRNDPNRFDIYEKELTYMDSYYGGDDVLLFSTATKKFTYNYYPIKKEIVTYDINGQNPMVESISYEYNLRNNLTSEEKMISGTGNYMKTKYYYPYDLTSDPFMSNLVDNYLISEAIIKENYKNDVLLSKSKTSYVKDATTNNFVLPKSIYSAKFPNVLPPIPFIGNLEKKVTYDQYNDKGNIQQFTQESGIPVSIIWGYNKTLPVAKIENATNTAISDLLGTSLDFIDENNLGQINGLRISLPNAMVTTYTHTPLIGVSTITDPKGLTMYYEYDSFNRLKWIIDQDGNVIEKYCYNYKGQQVNCDEVVYKNIVKSGTFQKNNCGAGFTGGFVTYNVAAGMYSSTNSQVDANNQAQTDVDSNGQNYANSIGNCTAQAAATFSYDYGYYPELSQLNIDLMASHTNHSGANYNLRIIYKISSGSQRILNRSLILEAGRLYKIENIPFSATEVVDVQLISLIIN